MSLPLILRIFKNDQIVEVKQFQLEQVVIGKNAEVDLDLDDSRVSAIHALIEKRDDRYFICDLGSQSGTFKNGIQIIDEPIDSGDEIQLGSYKIVFNVGIPRPKSKVPNQSLSASVPKVQIDEYSKTIPLQDFVLQESSETVPSQKPVVKESTKTVPLQNPVEEDSVETITLHNSVVEDSTKTVSLDSFDKIEASKISKDEKDAVAKLSVSNTVPAVENKKTGLKPNLGKAMKVVRGDDVLIIDPRANKDRIAVSTSAGSESKKQSSSNIEIDVNKIIKPSKGSVLEVSIAWKERIIETYHFSGNKIVNIGSKDLDQIALPNSILKNSFRLLELQGTTVLVNIRPDMVGDLILQKGTISFPTLETTGRLVKKGISSQLRLDQDEALRIAILGGQINIFIRFIPKSAKPVLLPFLPFSVGELASLMLAFAIVGLMAFYNSIHTPIEVEDQANQELLRMAQIIYQKPKMPAPDYAREKVTPPPEVKPPEAKPIEVKKVELGEKTQAGNSVGEASKTSGKIGKKENHTAAGAKSQGRAADIKARPNGKSSKKISSSNQGGSIKLGEKSGANAKANTQVDLSKLGLASSFGSGGIRQKIDQAVSGAGGVMGDALSATGSAGMKANRSGDDLGSAFKDTGASGLGTATEGITGGITKGRSSGYTQYGSEGSGLGDHRGVEVSAPGAGEFIGTIDREAVRRVIRSKKDLLRNCYERELRGKPNLGGKLVIAWRIAAAGKVESVKIQSSDLNDPLVENCIVQEFYTWRFPEPPEGGVANVAFPFVFQKRN